VKVQGYFAEQERRQAFEKARQLSYNSEPRKTNKLQQAPYKSQK
jgi:hypothetical protein